jgi:hypothetical protein
VFGDPVLRLPIVLEELAKLEPIGSRADDAPVVLAEACSVGDVAVVEEPDRGWFEPTWALKLLRLR